MWRHIVVVSRPTAEHHLGVRLDRPYIVARREPLNALLGAHINGLIERASSLPAEAGPRLDASVVSAIGALFCGGASDHPDHRKAFQDALRARIQRYVEAHLGEVDLTPARIARAHGVSLRYLHRLFEATDTTVAASITAVRLDRARALAHQALYMVAR
jgi:hypothetical protein